jgi:hypothetical protein
MRRAGYLVGFPVEMPGNDRIDHRLRRGGFLCRVCATGVIPAETDNWDQSADVKSEMNCLTFAPNVFDAGFRREVERKRSPFRAAPSQHTR